jgi:uncharacterized protein (UPF0254 family)
MSRPEDLMIPSDVKAELRQKVDGVRKRMKNGFPTSREMRACIVDLAEVLDFLIVRAQ